MALSLSGERSIAAGSRATPIRAFFAWLGQVRANRTRRTALVSLLTLDATQLRDLGITAQDVAEALNVRDGRTPGMVLNAARARNARG